MQPGGGDSAAVGAARDHISVVVVDDHEMVAEALLRALAEEPDLDVVGQAPTAASALAVARDRTPDVMVVASRLPDATGAEATQLLHGELPATTVVVLGASDHVEERAAALEAGAAAFVWKGERVDALLAAIRGTARRASPRQSAPTTSGVGADLTAREREVLGLLAEGLSTDEIVDRLVLSPHTVRNHIRSVLAKLGAHSRLEAVAVAARAGVIRLAQEPPERQ